MKKILVVDDEPTLREMLKDILSNENFAVITAGDGAEGLRKIYEESPDLIILDCSMPLLDGYEMLEKMRSDPLLVNKPVIMLSVRNREKDEIKGLKLGVDDYVTKPFKAALLIARVRAVIERKTKSISANPLTLLAGNTTVREEAEKRIRDNVAFSMIYIDLSNFKSFNDKYGFQRGDEVIKHTANILIRAVREFGAKNDFIGHIGGDDFIILTSPGYYAKICSSIIEQFDRTIVDFYDLDDRKKGCIISIDRNNAVQKFPIMTIALSVISTDYTKVTHYGQMSQAAAELKKFAKRSEKSRYVVDRRRE